MNTLGYREPRGQGTRPTGESKARRELPTSVACVERVIAARHAYASADNEGNRERLFQAVDNLASQYGLRRLQGTLGGLVSTLGDATPQQRATEIAKGLSNRI